MWLWTHHFTCPLRGATRRFRNPLTFLLIVQCTAQIDLYHPAIVVLREWKRNIGLPTPQAEKKKQEYEQLKQKRLERQKRLDFLNQESHREELELARLSQELGIDKNSPGYQSEPTTPPELQDSGFPTPLSKPNRFSAGNLISPSAIFGNHSKGDAHLTSPPTERARAYNALTAAAPSVSQSKSNSDEEDNHDETLDFNHRPAAS